MKRFGSTTKFFLVLTGIAAILTGSPAFADRDDDDREKGWLGVFLEGNSDQEGIKIVSVIGDSPAEKAGFQNGDLIVRVNGVEIEDPERFFEEFKGFRPDDRVEIIVLRDGDEEELVVTLGERSRRAIRIPHIRREIHRGHHGPEMRHRGYLGVHLQNLTDELREYFGVPEGEGVLIAKVEEDSPAGEAGLKAGDVITEANGEAIDRPGSLMKALRGKEEGDPVGITFYRDGRMDTVEAIAGSTESHVFDVNSFIWCDDDEDGEGCGGEYSFNFDFDEGGWQESIQNLQEYFGSEDFQDRVRDYTRQYQDIEKQLERKMEMLEKKLREMEKRLQELHEKEGGASRKLLKPAKPGKPARV